MTISDRPNSKNDMGALIKRSGNNPGKQKVPGNGAAGETVIVSTCAACPLRLDRGLERFGKPQKEFGKAEGPVRAERAGASESLGRVRCRTPARLDVPVGQDEQDGQDAILTRNSERGVRN